MASSHAGNEIDGGLGDAVKVLTRGHKPKLWTAPPWVLQESGYALRGGKDLILLREANVEEFGMQGDLEYIPFTAELPTSVFAKLSEMINGLLAKASGTTIDIVVESRATEAQTVPEPAAIVRDEAELAKRTEAKRSVLDEAIDMLGAGNSKDFQGMLRYYQAACALLESGADSDLDRLTLDCAYHRSRFEAGAANGLEMLRSLQVANPESPEPPKEIAAVLFRNKEFEEAATHFVTAASLSKKTKDRVDLLTRAAEAYRRAKRYDEGKKVAYEALTLPSSNGSLSEEAVSVLYELLKANGESHYGFAVAEAALHDNPQHPLRFKLGLDYHAARMYKFFLYHFKFIDEHQPNSSALHNLALAFSECKLPISSVSNYKRAFAMGEALSGANLGFDYLACGMADEAQDIITKAMAIEKHEARVETCLAAIIERTQEEETKAEELLTTVAGERKTYVQIGIGLRRTPDKSIDGTWEFSFGPMPLSVSGGVVRGKAERRVQETSFGSSLGALAGAAIGGGEKNERIERYSLTGTLTGSVCKFEMQVDPGPSSSAFTLLAGTGGTRKESGFIVFNEDGITATYAELKDSELKKARTMFKR